MPPNLAHIRQPIIMTPILEPIALEMLSEVDTDLDISVEAQIHGALHDIDEAQQLETFFVVQEGDTGVLDHREGFEVGVVHEELVQYEAQFFSRVAEVLVPAALQADFDHGVDDREVDAAEEQGAEGSLGEENVARAKVGLVEVWRGMHEGSHVVAVEVAHDHSLDFCGELFDRRGTVVDE